MITLNLSQCRSRNISLSRDHDFNIGESEFLTAANDNWYVVGYSHPTSAIPSVSSISAVRLKHDARSKLLDCGVMTAHIVRSAKITATDAGYSLEVHGSAGVSGDKFHWRKWMAVYRTTNFP